MTAQADRDLLACLFLCKSRKYEISVKYNARVLLYVIIVFLSFLISFEQMFILIEKEFDIKKFFDYCTVSYVKLCTHSSDLKRLNTLLEHIYIINLTVLHEVICLSSCGSIV